MWWMYVLIVVVLALGVYAFGRLVRWNTRAIMKHRDTTSLDEIYWRNRDRVPRRRRRD